MKIKVNNIKEKFFNKKEELTDKRNGFKDFESSEDLSIKKKGVKILVSFILLLSLTFSLGIRGKEFISYSNKEENKIFAKALDSVATFSSVDNVENEKVLATKYEEKLIFSKPLEGKIQKMYSIDNVIYSKTLNKWKTHEGIDISSPVGTAVLAMEKGKIEKIYDDALLGKTIVISHIAGYKSVYSNLEENVFVNIGDSVVKGQRIGRVGATAKSESLDEPHLHLCVYLGSNTVDPTYIYD